MGSNFNGVKKDGKLLNKPSVLFVLPVKDSSEIIYAFGREIYLSQKQLMELTYGRKFSQKELDAIEKH